MKILHCITLSLAVVAMNATLTNTFAQSLDKTGEMKVSRSVEQIEIIANTAKRLEFDYDIPDIVVENEQVIRVRPVARNQLLVIGLRPGVTAVTVRDTEGKLQHVEVQVTADVRDLQRTLKKHFPSSNIRAIPLKEGVMLTGTVGQANDVNTIVELATDYFPARVLNRMVIDGSQMVAIEVKVYEVSRSKLRRLGVDWAVVTDNFNIGSSIAGIIGQLSPNPGVLPTAGNAPITFGVLSNGDQFSAFIDALEQRDMAKLMDQPTLVAINGRAAEFLSGGEIPIQVASGLGTNSIEFRPFGTKLDIVPKLLGGGRMRLELRAEVSEIANDLSNGSGVPGFRVRRVNTAVTMKAGHTLALAGDYREEEESQVRGIPGLLNLPAIGTAFRRTQDSRNETELVFLITPRFVGEVPQGQVQNPSVGRMTSSPSDEELYFKGFVEVPKCGEDCPTQNFDPQQSLQNWSQTIRARGRNNAQPIKYSPQNPNNSTQPATQSGFGYPTSKVYSIGSGNQISYQMPQSSYYQQSNVQRTANNPNYQNYSSRRTTRR